jgi:hypothetical protein
MNELELIYRFVYMYCVDFLINLSNILGSSYYELNFVLFCVLFPFLCVVLPLIYLILKIVTSRTNSYND